MDIQMTRKITALLRKMVEQAHGITSVELLASNGASKRLAVQTNYA